MCLLIKINKNRHERKVIATNTLADMYKINEKYKKIDRWIYLDSKLREMIWEAEINRRKREQI